MLKIEKPKSKDFRRPNNILLYLEKFQESWCWYELNSHGPVPCPRSLHACVAFENNIYIFGGYDGVNRKNDFYKYNVETNTWTQIVNSAASGSQNPSMIVAGSVGIINTASLVQSDSQIIPSPRDRHVASKSSLLRRFSSCA